jgi:uncharacterized protein (DUF1330 family)
LFTRLETPPSPVDEETEMAAYLIVDLEVTDPNGIEEYRQRVPATLQKYGGKFLVRGGRWEKLEGQWEPTRVVVIEFPSAEAAKHWYDSEEYREPKKLRLNSARTNLILVEGV